MRFLPFSARKCKRIIFLGAGLGAVLGLAKLSFLCGNSFVDSSINVVTLGVYKSVLCKSTTPSRQDAAKGAYVNSKLRESEFNFSSPRHTTHRVHSNHLFSNNPGEDRYILGFDTSRDLSMFSVIDGHGGWQCADVIKHNILSHTMANVAPAQKETLKSIDPSTLGHFNHSLESLPMLPVEEECTGSELQSVREKLSKAFLGLDESLSERALKDVRLISKGHFMTEDMREHIMQAICGACAILAYFKGKDLFVASVGDCRAVLGRRSEGKWLPIPLSKDQQYDNDEELKRLHKEHPGEEKTVVVGGRLLGSLMPLRAFGDVSYKWTIDDLLILHSPIVAGYHTPPYLTAKPVVTHHHISKGDRFLVLASDGLWEKLTNSQVVELVGGFIDSQKLENEKRAENPMFWQRQTSDQVQDDNVATHLIRHALGGTQDAIYQVLRIGPPLARMARDDITVTVIFFKE